MDESRDSNGNSASAPDMQRKREVFRLLDAMDPSHAFDAVCSWIRRRLAWYEEHFADLAHAVDRAEHSKAATALQHENRRLALELARWKAIAEGNGGRK